MTWLWVPSNPGNIENAFKKDYNRVVTIISKNVPKVADPKRPWEEERIRISSK